MIERPEYLRVRQIQMTFTEPATLVRRVADWNDDGDWVEEPDQRTPLAVSTQPMAADDARSRVILEAGVQLDDMRRLWSVEILEPQTNNNAGDLIEYEGETWRVQMTNRWPTHSESVIVRQEGQVGNDA